MTPEVDPAPLRIRTIADTAVTRGRLRGTRPHLCDPAPRRHRFSLARTDESTHPGAVEPCGAAAPWIHRALQRATI
jgi:hypothetical protein